MTDPTSVTARADNERDLAERIKGADPDAADEMDLITARKRIEALEAEVGLLRQQVDRLRDVVLGEGENPPTWPR